MDATTTYTSDGLTAADVTRALHGAGFRVEPPRQVRRTLLDTFDGRLNAARLRLELREDAGSELVLTGEGSPPARLGVAALPRFASDLPPGPFRARLSPILDVRALLPVLGVTSRDTVATRTDADGKARVAVVVHDEARPDGDDAHRHVWAAVIEALPGYPKDGAKAACLLGSLGLRPRQGDLVDVAAEATGVDLRGFHPSPTVPLHPTEPALDAFRRVLSNLAATIDATWEGTVDDVDPEFLHDLRVAVRRTRSVLAQGKTLLPAQVRDLYRREFGWLGETTGRARDLDVYVIEWSGYVAPLGPEDASALTPVLEHLAHQRREAHATLAAALRGRRYRTLMAGWRSWLEGPAAPMQREAERAIGRIAAGRTKRAQGRLLARGRSIHPDTPAEELHELRKDAKKLRYLLECFGSLYEAAPRKAFVQRLKALQDNLGEHQDTEVHVTELRRLSSELHGTPGVGADTLVAIGRLTEHLERRRVAAREEFAERFANYDTKTTSRALAHLLGAASDRVTERPRARR